jgi:MFS family permease
LSRRIDSSPLGRSFWKLFAASGASNCADGITTISLPLLAAAMTDSPVLVSWLTAFAFLPWLLFGLPGGALVDRLDRRRAMATVNGIRAALLGVLVALLLTGMADILVLYVAAFALAPARWSTTRPPAPSCPRSSTAGGSTAPTVG